MTNPFNGNLKIFIAGIIIIIIALSGVYFQYKKLSSAREDLAFEEKQLEAAINKLDFLIELEDNAPELQSQLTAFNMAVPSEPGRNQLVRKIHNASGSDGRITEVQFDERIEHEDYQEIPVFVAYEGRYFGLINLLASLKQDQRFFRIDSLDISQGREGQPNIRVDISMSAFYSN